MQPIFLSLAILSLSAQPPAKTPSAGIRPTAADGRVLNLDFETGNLQDWTAEGTAFAGQPVRGDTVQKRRGDMRSRHQGEYWIGTFERAGDKPRGTLTSVLFPVTHPWCSFLIAGGSSNQTRVELLDENGKVITRVVGDDTEDLKRVAVELAKQVGTSIRIKLVDQSSTGWGHINFDDFRFHSEKPSSATRATPSSPDEYKFSGLSPEKAAEAMTVPEGFEVKLFAGEPDVHQPVALCLDDRGRVWVAEAYIYPKRHPAPGPFLPEAERVKGDRIVILEDTNGDGKHDKRTVFLEGLNLVSGLEVGFDGVWIGAAPYLIFVPHDKATDKPAGEAKILLDGWGYQDTHETLNSFIWGPDGWLYGCHGVFTHSRVGKPGTPDKDRVAINAGIWRYHPVRHQFEVFAHGTSNPWGLDYNDVGDFFIEACVIPHCFHIIHNARYQRQAGQHFNPYTYADIQTIADHRHYVGNNPHGGNNRSDSMGGGHAHCGLMCYLGGTWPAEYRGQLFMGNIHGRRLNVDIPKPQGSGYVASHGKDFLLANDEWARFINMRYGPDGNVYLIDWYDKQACHRNEPEIWDRTNGRVFKICYKGTKPVAGIDLSKCTDAELVEYQLHDNDWYVRHARRILQERAATAATEQAKAFQAATSRLDEISREGNDVSRRLRGLWAAHATGTIRQDALIGMLNDSSDQIRAWAIQLLFEQPDTASVALPKLAELASTDSSPVVSRAIASALLRIPPGKRWNVLTPLLTRPVEMNDPNLAYLFWYALEPLAELDPQRMLKLAASSPIPTLYPFATRRVAAIGTPEAFTLLIDQLREGNNEAQQMAILNGLSDALKGRRNVQAPPSWEKAFENLQASKNPDVRTVALTVAVSLGDQRAFSILRQTVADASGDLVTRRAALSSLLGARDSELAPILLRLLAEPSLRAEAIRGLAGYDHPQTASELVKLYSTLSAAEKRDVLNTLASRSGSAKALLDAIGTKTIPAGDVPAEIIRQLRNLKDASLDQQIVAVWGTVRESSAERKQVLAAWQKKLTAPYQGAPDLPHGRAVYAKVCQQCHTLYGIGGKVGPDITGANRADLGYLLENIFDPSAVIPKEYAATRLELIDGRVIIGIVKEETNSALTVVTANETITVPVADVEKRTPSDLSMMPDDLITPLTEQDLRALISYLRHPVQVPLRATVDNAGEFFNGKDLTGWDGDREVWSVENGEIVGKTATGLKRNNFLISQMEVSDFRLTLKVKLLPNSENSGIQFRSVPIEGGEMRGPQADIGQGWWGKLYEESARGLLVKEGAEKHVKPEDWNEYVIEAIGPTVKMWINGQQCVNYTDEKLARKGFIAVQVHSGKNPMEVRFKDLKLEVLSK